VRKRLQFADWTRFRKRQQVTLTVRRIGEVAPDHAPSGSWVFETGGAAVENTSLMMYRRWDLRPRCGLGDRESTYFDVNGFSGRSLADKYYSVTNAGILT
jgi:hypothetical protein